MAFWSRRVVYVQITSERLSVRLTGSGREWVGTPHLGLIERRGRPEIVAVGLADVEKASRDLRVPVTIANGFSHPRTIIADAGLAWGALCPSIYAVAAGGPLSRLLVLTPNVILHPQGPLDGGITAVEVEALRQATGFAANRTYVWTGESLNDQQIISGRFPGSHWHGKSPPWTRVRW